MFKIFLFLLLGLICFRLVVYCLLPVCLCGYVCLCFLILLSACLLVLFICVYIYLRVSDLAC